MWLQSWQVNGHHDLFTTSVAGEMACAATATLHGIHWPDEDLRLGQQERPFYPIARLHVHPCSLGWLYPPTRTCNELSGMIDKREIPSQSRVAWSRVACSPQHFFGIFSFPTPSESPWTVSFFTPKVMAACMTLPMTGALLRTCLFWLCPDYQHKEDWCAWAECEEHPGH